MRLKVETSDGIPIICDSTGASVYVIIKETGRIFVTIDLNGKAQADALGINLPTNQARTISRFEAETTIHGTRVKIIGKGHWITVTANGHDILKLDLREAHMEMGYNGLQEVA